MVKGEEHFPVYFMVAASAKNTRLRSRALSEIYTEEQFKKVPKKNLEEEQILVQNIVQSVLDINNQNFDTILFGTLFHLLPNYPLFPNSPFTAGIDRVGVKFSMDDLLKEDNLFAIDWFEGKIQKKIFSLLKRKNPKKEIELQAFNKAFIHSFFVILDNVVRSNQNKYKHIIIRYSKYFADISQHVSKSLDPTYKIPSIGKRKEGLGSGAFWIKKRVNKS